MKLSRIAFGLGLSALGIACSASPSSEGPAISSEMEQAIDTYVRMQADPIGTPDGGVGGGKTPGGNGGASIGGIDPVTLGNGLRAGAAGVPIGGAASGPSNAGNGGTGSTGLVGGAGSPTGAGNGGVAVGPVGVGGGASSFAEAACYMIGNLCRYVTRCATGETLRGELCSVPSSCPAIVSRALAGASIPPQAASLVRCFGDGLGAASCVSNGDFFEGLAPYLTRCGGAAPSSR